MDKTSLDDGRSPLLRIVCDSDLVWCIYHQILHTGSLVTNLSSESAFIRSLVSRPIIDDLMLSSVPQLLRWRAFKIVDKRHRIPWAIGHLTSLKLDPDSEHGKLLLHQVITCRNRHYGSENLLCFSKRIRKYAEVIQKSLNSDYLAQDLGLKNLAERILFFLVFKILVFYWE